MPDTPSMTEDTFLPLDIDIDTLYKGAFKHAISWMPEINYFFLFPRIKKQTIKNVFWKH